MRVLEGRVDRGGKWWMDRDEDWARRLWLC